MSTQSLSAQIGAPPRHWLYNATGTTPGGFTLPALPASPSSTTENGSSSTALETVPSPSLTLRTSTPNTLTLHPRHTVLLVIDMQNYFLSQGLARHISAGSGAQKREKGAGHAACEQLLQYAVPAARRAGIRVVWLNWGLTEGELEGMPAAVTRCFGFSGFAAGEARGDGVGDGVGDEDAEEGEEERGYGEKREVKMDRHGKVREGHAGLGSEMGVLTLPEEEGGGEVDAGKVLMRGTWNAALYAPMKAAYDEKTDVWIHKNRMSGLWGAGTACTEFLEAEGVRTLLFAGVNTDQCVGGSLTDAFSRGYECVLLRDGCGTTSPDFAQRCWEWNCENTFGFVTSCRDLYDAAFAS